MLYAVDIKTKEHRIIGSFLGEPALRFGEKIIEADDDGWIPWSGYGVPVPYGSLVDVRRRNGATHMGIVAEPGSWWVECIAYRPILDEFSEPETPAWNGEGLPPVGCECVYLGTEERQGEITHHTRYAAVIEYPNGGYDVGGPMCFRPIRSEEDHCIDQIMNDCGVARCVARTIYEEGYRKVEESYD